MGPRHRRLILLPPILAPDHTMNTLADTIIRPGHLALSYTERLLKDVTPDIFARKPRIDSPPRIIDINHPAFCLGHLATYPARLLEWCNLPTAAAAVPATYADLFAAGKECHDDPDGTIYPPMAEITERYFASFRHLLEALTTVPDHILTAPNPAEGRFKEILPSLAAAANFMVAPHIMMHLGQISAWRRCFNLGPAM